MRSWGRQGLVDDLRAVRKELRVRDAELHQAIDDSVEMRKERDNCKRDWQAELDGNSALREQYGARDNESVPVFVGRLVAERDRLAERVEQAELSRDAEWKAQKEQRARAEAAEALAYLGEHHFPDLTYKTRCEELVAALARLRAQQQPESCGRCDGTGKVTSRMLGTDYVAHDCPDCSGTGKRAQQQPEPQPEPFYIVCEHNGPDCQFIETETEDGHGVGPTVAGEWSKHPLHDEFSRLGPYVLATIPQPALLLARDGDAGVLLAKQRNLAGPIKFLGFWERALARAHVGTLGPVVELMREAERMLSLGPEINVDGLRDALANPELRRLGEPEV